nr:phenylacetate-CoA oxygenase subunit PaaI [Acidimicrobiia bacterium]
MIGSEHLLALADDEHLMGQQHTEWIGVAPFLEEDLAFCSIAQDELGHAAALYELLVAGDGDADALAFGRPHDEYRSCHLVELPCPDWADALVRHWLYDLAERHRWAALAESSVSAVAALVERVEREESYHRRHAAALLDRVFDGAAGERVRAALDTLLPYADALWD